MRLVAGCFGRLNMTDWVGHPHPIEKTTITKKINKGANYVTLRK